ncbi:MAG: DUF3630 family protein [Parashewanella sp.]
MDATTFEAKLKTKSQTARTFQISNIRLDAEALSLQFQSNINFESFEQFAQPFTKKFECRVIQQHYGADRHQWQVEFEGCFLTLNYEYYSDSCWLKAEHQADIETLQFLKSVMEKYPTISSAEVNGYEGN